MAISQPASSLCHFYPFEITGNVSSFKIEGFFHGHPVIKLDQCKESGKREEQGQITQW